MSGDSLKLVGDFEGMHSQFISYSFLDRELVIATEDDVRSYSISPDQWPLNRESAFEPITLINAPEIHTVLNQGGIVANLGGRVRSTFGHIESDKRIPADFSLLSARPQGDSTWLVYTGELNGQRQTLVQCINVQGHSLVVARLDLPISYINRGKLYVQGLPNGDILIGGIRGVLLVENPSSEKPILTNLLPGTTVYDVKVDEKGNLWIATTTQGLLLIPDLNVRQHDFSTVDAPIVDLIAPEQGDFLYGLTYSGVLYQLHPTFQKFNSDGRHTRFWQSYQEDYYVSHVKVHPSVPNDVNRALLQELSSVKESVLLPDGSIAMATAVRSLLRFPYGDARLIQRSNSFPYLNLPLINRPSANTIEKKGAILRLRRSTGVTFDHNRNALYVAYNDGLICYPTGTGPEIPITDSLVGGRAQILSVVNDKLYIGLSGTGLSVLDLKTNKSVLFLPQLAIERIHHAGNKVWLETNKGIYRSSLDNESPRFQPIDTRSGLPPGKPTAFFANEAFAYAVYDRRVIRIQSDQPITEATGRTVAFAKTERAGISLVKPNSKVFKVTANTQTLRFQPRIPDYAESPTASFEFRLDESDENWRKIGGENASIFLSGISEGSHQLDVRLTGHPESQSSYRIEASIPFWRKPWPYILAISMLAMFAIFITRRRARGRQLEAERQTALRESQLAALAAQMNPHFIFNALNSVQDFIMSNDRLAANDYLTKFAKLIRLTLEHSRSAEITLEQELIMMQTYLDLERVRFDDEIEIDFSYSDDLRLSTKLPSLVVQPYVENAFKHGLMHRMKDRRLRVRYEMPTEKTLRVIVEDNGVGRARATILSDASRTGNKFATGATARRLELLNSKYLEACRVEIEDLVENSKASGTRVTIELRVSLKKENNMTSKTEGHANT